MSDPPAPRRPDGTSLLGAPDSASEYKKYALQRLRAEYQRGYANGVRAGLEVGPSWTNLIVVAVCTLVAGIFIGAVWL